MEPEERDGNLMLQYIHVVHLNKPLTRHMLEQNMYIVLYSCCVIVINYIEKLYYSYIVAYF